MNSGASKPRARLRTLGMPDSPQQPLDHFRFGLVAGEGDLDELAAATSATATTAVRIVTGAVGAAVVRTAFVAR